MPENHTTVVGVFSDSRRLVEAVEAMREGGYNVLEALSPIPLPELDELLPHRPSSVRWFTLLGCIAGAVLGMAFQIMTVLQWPILTGGKPVVSLPAFVIISFEMTILFGASATLLGLMLNARLPQIGKDWYHEGCSQSDFALVVECDAAGRAGAVAMLLEAGAREIREVEPKSVWIGAD